MSSHPDSKNEPFRLLDLKGFLNECSFVLNLIALVGVRIRFAGAGQYEAFMYFLSLEGKEIKKIPLEADIKVTTFAYQENGVIYNQGNKFIK